MLNPSSLSFACPLCRSPLEQNTLDEMRCPRDQLLFLRIDGIWRMLLPEREAGFSQFTNEYETVRRGEGRGLPNSEYYRSLPERDLSQRMEADWRIRAISFKALLRQVIQPMEEQRRRKPMRALDLGAGNAWLSNRLAERGHCLAAVDLIINDFDGLGCCRYYATEFVPVQAEFDHLPFADQSVDLVVFNASLHYSTCYENTLGEAQRVLEPGGKAVILDSPVYQDGNSGARMVREREDRFAAQYGFRSNALPSENYLTYQRISDLAASLGMSCQLHTPNYGVSWELRPIKARLLGMREPAKFHLVVFTVG